MKDILKGAAAAALGLVLALGPKFLFKACSLDCGCCGEFPQCLWSTQAVLGLGIMIAALGMCMIIFPNPKIQFGLLVSIFVTAVIAILIPYALIGGCPGRNMADYRRAFPGIAIVSAITLAYSAALTFFIIRKNRTTQG
jgi:hypothetical protein